MWRAARHRYRLTLPSAELRLNGVAAGALTSYAFAVTDARGRLTSGPRVREYVVGLVAVGSWLPVNRS
jgi:hypothetical protein